MKLKKYVIFTISAFIMSGMTYSQAQNQGTNKNEPAKSDEANASYSTDKNWINPDFKSYEKALDDLIKLSDEYAKNKYRLARSNYQTGKSLIQKMREDVQRFREEAVEERHMDEKWYWQTLDRKMKEEKVVSYKTRNAKLKAVTYFTRAIYHLDEIANKRVRESEAFKTLLANVYREWAMAQYDLGNLPQTIDVLNRYLALGPEYEEEPSPHKYLASAYGFQQRLLEKYGSGTEQDLIYFKKKKNEHLLRATELIYKKGSPEYERLMEIVNQDEIIAINPPE